MPRRFLITGAAGFLGADFVRCQLKNSADDLVVYALVYARNLASLAHGGYWLLTTNNGFLFTNR